MKNMPDTFSIDFACLQISPFETVILYSFWDIPQISLRASSPIWASKASRARTRERAAVAAINCKTRTFSRGSLRLPKQESLLAG